jgi:hypothetical protein
MRLTEAVKPDPEIWCFMLTMLRTPAETGNKKTPGRIPGGLNKRA